MIVNANLARGLVVVAWTGLLLGLWVTGETARYLGPRTAWLVPFGAITLLVAGCAYLFFTTWLRRPVEALSLREAAGLAALLLPICAVALVPKPELGALAASKKLSNRALIFPKLASRTSGPRAKVSFFSIASANVSSTYAASIGLRPGLPADLTGFVIRPRGAPPGTFEIARFYIACCAADALPLIVPVHASGADYGNDTWLEVKGHLERRQGNLGIKADNIVRVEAPNHPYLSAYSQ